MLKDTIEALSITALAEVAVLFLFAATVILVLP